jgi:hypothetical protein
MVRSSSSESVVAVVEGVQEDLRSTDLVKLGELLTSMSRNATRLESHTMERSKPAMCVCMMCRDAVSGSFCGKRPTLAAKRVYRQASRLKNGVNESKRLSSTVWYQ